MTQPHRNAGDEPLPDHTTREGRQALARMVTRLFELWGLGAGDQCALLGLAEDSRATLRRYRQGQPLATNRDLLDRVGHLLAIHKSLRILYPYNDGFRRAWITTPDRRLDGRTPLEVMKERGLVGVAAIRRWLDAERGR